MAYLEQTYDVSERRACRVLALHRSTQRRQSGQPAQRALIQRLQRLAEQYPRFGYRKIYHLLQAERWRVKRETVRQLRQQEGWPVIKKKQKRRPVGVRTTTPTRAAHPHHVWSDDCVHDETTEGRRLQCLTG